LRRATADGDGNWVADFSVPWDGEPALDIAPGTGGTVLEWDDDGDATQVWWAANQPPVAHAGGPYSVPEGGSVVFTGSGSDPDGDPLTYAWDLDNDGSFETAGQNPTFSAAGRDGPSSQAVVLQVCDDKDACDTSSSEVNITNVAPTATFNAPAEVDEGSDINLSLVAPFDPSPDDTTAGLEYAFDCGSGYGSFSTSNGAVCSTDDNGVHTVQGKIRDKDGGETEYTASVTVHNVAPTVGDITAPIDPVEVGTPVEASASFSDPGTADTHYAEWDWGDGSTSPGTVNEMNGSGSVSGSHTYTAAGVYSVKLTVTDDDGGSGESLFQYVVIYAPEGGFVTGSGWIDSPAGAYSPDPSLTGMAIFGFVSEYQKGATAPSGQTQFQFRVAHLRFRSTGYQWLVIAGAQAKFKGWGTINGGGDYGFMLSATDGQVNGGGGVDKFRIKIWDQATEEVVYDNQMGDADDADATDAIERGRIVIHKPKK
jgi:PKD repeat protein